MSWAGCLEDLKRDQEGTLDSFGPPLSALTPTLQIAGALERQVGRGSAAS